MFSNSSIGMYGFNDSHADNKGTSINHELTNADGNVVDHPGFVKQSLLPFVMYFVHRCQVEIRLWLEHD